MDSIEITYRLATGYIGLKPRPTDSAAALSRLNEGAQGIARLFEEASAEPGGRQRVIMVDPSDIGLVVAGQATPAQRPFAVVLGCSDARVPIELIFNEGPNDLFVVRVAGNGLGEDVRGSIRYALEHLGESLKLIVVLGHSACGAVSAAVDVFLNPSGYLALASQHAVRSVVDRLHIIVHAAARSMEKKFGTAINHHPHYREALIEFAAIGNAAVTAHTLAEECNNRHGDQLKVVYGLYALEQRQLWAPRCGSIQVEGLATPPVNDEQFAEFADAVLSSQRICKLLEK